MEHTYKVFRPPTFFEKLQTIYENGKIPLRVGRRMAERAFDGRFRYGSTGFGKTEPTMNGRIPAILSMNKLIIQIYGGFCCSRGKSANFLFLPNPAMGTRDLGVIAVKILTWLKVEAKNKSRRSLQLNLKYTWCKNLVRLVQLDSELFLQIFSCRGQ